MNPLSECSLLQRRLQKSDFLARNSEAAGICARYRVAAIFRFPPSNSCLQKGRPTKNCDGALHKKSKKLFILQCSKLAALHLLLAGQHIGQPAVGGGESKNITPCPTPTAAVATVEGVT